MADDLSRGGQRRTNQDRITENRDSVMPSRRETRVADVQVRADVRSAATGGSQTQAINRFFSQIEGATEAYYQHDISDRKEKAEIAYADGVLDASAGRELDPEQAQAVAYQRAYYSVTASARQTAFETETQEELARMIEGGSNVEDIEAYTNERTKAFIDESTDLFDEPDTREQVGTRLSRWADQTNSRVSTALKEKTDTELMTMTNAEVAAVLERGEEYDLIGTVDRLSAAGLNRDKVQDELVGSVIAYAIRTGDASVLHRLDDIRRPEDVAAEVEAAREAAANAPEIVGSELPALEAVTEPVTTEPAKASTWTAPLDMSNVSSGYGHRRAPIRGASTNHQALDIAVPVGTPVAAPADGVIQFAGPRGKGGISVIIEHADGTTTGYAHLDSTSVKAGDTVKQGTVFAASGNTGNSTGPHLHMTARRNGQRIDPRTLIGTTAPASANANAAETEAVEATTEQPNVGVRARAAGASVLTANQQIRVLNAVSQIEGESDRRAETARVEQKDELMLDLWTRAQDGEDVSEIIETNVRSGILEVGEGMTMTNAFRSLKESTLDGQANEDTVLGYERRFAVAEPSYSSIITGLDSDYRAGKFGTGRNATRAYLTLRQRAAAGSRQDRGLPPEEKRTATVARGYVGQSLSVLTGEFATQDQRKLSAEAMIEWERKVASGTAPMTAADQIIAEYTPRFNSRPAAASANARPVGSTGQTAAPATVGNQSYNYVAGQGLVPAK